MAVSGSVAREVDEAAEHPPSGQADIDALMRRSLRVRTNQDDMARRALTDTAAAAQPALPRRDFDMATELLDRAVKAFDVLIDRCQSLDHELDDEREQARTRTAEHEKAVEHWKQLASGFEARAAGFERRGAALETRCDAAGARADMAEQKAAMLERASAQAIAYAATADQLSTKLHDRVVSAFGLGSRARPVLEAVATRTAGD